MSGRDSVPFQSERGEGDGDVFGRSTEEVEDLTLPEAGGEARRVDTLSGNVQMRVNEGEDLKLSLKRGS